MLRRLSLGYSRLLSLAIDDVIRLQMPALSPTMTKGNVGNWSKKVGDKVNPGDPLVSIETDKAMVEYESIESGYLAAIYIQSGTEDVKCGELIGIMVEDESELPEAAALPSPTRTAPTIPSSSPKSPPSMASHNTARSVPFAMPSAALLLSQKGIDLGQVTASGPGGRILKQDAVAFLAVNPQSAVAAPQTEAVSPRLNTSPEHDKGTDRLSDRRSTNPFTDVKLTTMRRVIAERLSESKATIPHAYASATCTLDQLLALRSVLKTKGVFSSINDFVIRASALSLRDVPVLNSVYDDKIGSGRHCDTIDISVAVATEGGLITPIVTGADKRTISSISSAVRELAGKARSNKLRPEEFIGGSFTISNLGMFGINQFSAIINKPQACILAVGCGESQAVLSPNASKDDAIAADRLAVQTTMSVTLSYDQRVVSNAAASRWLAAFRSYIEQPAIMDY